ncbi:Sodium:solute symporter family-domain-containing protein [Lipomyces japonicus]|uniref:Sodium:solute symporter family-domain-containing protein n=1 Tax=Lipomyces japonicus TaxID=56871 RepID=UPI0034CEAF3C
MSSTAGPPLPQGVGYGIVVGLGFVFAAGMILTTYMLKRYQHERITSEEFSTAGRSVKTGLIASAVVSSWTWAATLLQSSGVAYRYGVSGPFWYASGGSVQIILFATIAIELKRRAPDAHTFLEVVRARYGAPAHIVFLLFGIATNILVTAMLLTGGSAVVNSLTGMNTVAACFLLPLGVIVYTLFGGIKATFLTDYIHTVIILVIIAIFAFKTYATSPLLGSPGEVWEILTQLSKQFPVSGNAEGSFLAMRSKEGAIFFVINIVGGFGTVFLDNGYWNKAIAASPASALPGYVIGGIAWFAIPWLCATTMGLACLALESNPSFPTYPLRMSSADVSAGLVLPNAAVALLGKGGGVCALILVFMAVTSATSAELIAVSSIGTYDIYKTYINPRASGRQLIFISHASVIIYGFVMAGFSVGLYYGGVSMGYLYLLMGVIISSAVLPATLTIMWNKQNVYAAVGSPILGLACSLMAWLVTTKKKYGVINVDTSGQNDPMLAGNVVALLSPLIFVPILTYIKPDNYDWLSMKAIKQVRDDTEIIEQIQTIEDNESKEINPQSDAEANIQFSITPNSNTVNYEKEAAALLKASRYARILTVIITLSFLVLWPMPMYGSGYVFSKKFFTGWVIVGIIWILVSMMLVCIYPVWEGRKVLFHTIKGVYMDITGQRARFLRARQGDVVEAHGQDILDSQEIIIEDKKE